MRKRILCFMTAFFIIISSAGTFLEAKTEDKTSPKADLAFVIESYKFILENYPFDVSESKLCEDAVKGMLTGLDPYSTYYNKEEAVEVYQDMLNEHIGIGMLYTYSKSNLKVIKVFRESPAKEAGLKADDLVLQINGKDIKDIDEKDVKNLITKSPDKKVNFLIMRNNKKMNIEIAVKKYKVNYVDMTYMDDILYIKIEEFMGGAAFELKNALDDARRKGVKKLIIDVRDNPGGLLSEVLKCAELFLSDEPILKIRKKGSDLRVITAPKNDKYRDFKTVILENEFSASASEVFIQALKNAKRAEVVGKTSFGKGVVQSLIPLKNGGIFKITTEEYLGSKGETINKLGVKPDYVIDNKDDNDLQLKKAVSILKEGD